MDNDQTLPKPETDIGGDLPEQPHVEPKPDAAIGGDLPEKP